MNTIESGTKVKARGYEGVIVREYMEGMYEVKLQSGVVVIPPCEFEVL